MEDFNGKIAVVTGGGTGMGRELVCHLIKAGAHVAMCDLFEDNMTETARLAAPADGQRLTSHLCDVSSEAQINRFRDEVVEQHETDHINLLFNNAGIGGGGTFVNIDREEWERTFGVCWYGVYYSCLAFMPLLVASEEGHVINTSSVNGFWASLGPGVSHTSYRASKFAVKGFTESLMEDLRLNAPHVKASVVMPGHIGTSIGLNTGKVLGRGGPGDMSAEQVEEMRKRLLSRGVPVSNMTDDHIREMAEQQALAFRDNAPTTAGQAANIILDGVRAGRWRILVGDDAQVLDEMVRANPEDAYTEGFIEGVRARGHLMAIGNRNEEN